jgi:hypothetical protein
MPIKFAEITIIRNIEEENMFRSLYRYFGYENQTIDNDIIIIQFDDGTLCDTRDEYKELNFKFAQLGHNHSFPIYFNKQIEDRHTLFYRNPIINDKGQRTLKLDVFKNYAHNKGNKSEQSKYNLVYEDINKKEIFSILKISSNEEKPRFMLGYEDTILNRDDIIYLSECIFKEKFT